MKVRILIVIFWIVLFFGFLFLPSLKNVFFPDCGINILAWPDMVDLETVSKFEKETGIKVNVSYYENNEELYARLRLTRGQGYDLMTITDNAVNYLRGQSFLKKIDKAKLNFWLDIDNHFTGHYFDPNNDFSIPYNWDIYGLGISNEYIKDKKPQSSWALIFDEKIAPRVSMIEDSYDAVLVAAQYLYGSINNLTEEKLQAITKLLIKQKKWVEAYTDLRADYFLNLGICPVMVGQSAYIYRANKSDDEANNNKENEFSFLIPNEGGFLIIDSLVIPEQSKKDEYVYKFINYLYQEGQVKGFYEDFGYLPVMKQILYSLNLNYLSSTLDEILQPDRFAKFAQFKRELPAQRISKLWIEVKSY